MGRVSTLVTLNFPLVTYISRYLPEGPIYFYGHCEEESSTLETMTNEIAVAMEKNSLNDSPPIRKGIYVLTLHQGER